MVGCEVEVKHKIVVIRPPRVSDREMCEKFVTELFALKCFALRREGGEIKSDTADNERLRVSLMAMLVSHDEENIVDFLIGKGNNLKKYFDVYLADSVDNLKLVLDAYHILF
jgi:hypothetical protein